MVRWILSFYLLNLLLNNTLYASSDNQNLENISKRIIYFKNGCTGILLNNRGIVLTTYDCVNSNTLSKVPLNFYAKKRSDELLFSDENFKIIIDKHSFSDSIVSSIDKKIGSKRVFHTRFKLIYTPPKQFISTELRNNYLQLNFTLIRLPIDRFNYSPLKVNFLKPIGIKSLESLTYSLRHLSDDNIKYAYKLIQTNYYNIYSLLFNNKEFSKWNISFKSLNTKFFNKRIKKDSIVSLALSSRHNKDLKYGLAIKFLDKLFELKNWLYLANTIKSNNPYFLSTVEKNRIKTYLKYIKKIEAQEKDFIFNSIRYLYSIHTDFIEGDIIKESYFLKTVYKNSSHRLDYDKLYTDSIIAFLKKVSLDYKHIDKLILLSIEKILSKKSNSISNKTSYQSALLTYPTQLNRQLKPYSTRSDLKSILSQTYDSTYYLQSYLFNNKVPYIHFYSDIDFIQSNSVIVYDSSNRFIGISMPYNFIDKMISALEYSKYIPRTILSYHFIYRLLEKQCPRIFKELEITD